MVVKYHPPRFLLITKRRIAASQWRKLADATLAKWFKSTSIVLLLASDITCFLLQYIGEDTTLLLWYSYKNAKLEFNQRKPHKI